MSFLSKAFGVALRTSRKAIKQSQAKFAESINSEAANISRWENGEYLPTDENIDSLLPALGISSEEFLRRMAGGAAKADLTLEQRAVLRRFDAAEVERQAIAMWCLTDDPHYLAEYEEAALERGHEAKALAAALTGLLAQSKKSLD